MADLSSLQRDIKERLKKLESQFKSVFEADVKKQGYLDKLKSFYKETGKGNSERWHKLDNRLKEFSTTISSAAAALSETQEKKNLAEQ